MSLAIRRMVLGLVFALAGSGTLRGQGSAPRPPLITLVEQTSGTDALLQAVSPVSQRVVWASGHAGTILLTLDGGGTWVTRPSEAGDSLQFRDVHGFSGREAVVLTSGNGPLSRLYRTEDGGASWSLTFLMEEPAGFLDCLDFLDETHGFAYGDSFDGVPFLLETKDGGRNWNRVSAAALPAAGQGEGGFAASGTCARAAPDGAFWIATGAGGNARLLSLRSGAGQWSVQEAPVVRGDAAGLTTVAFGAAGSGVALGGDLAQMEARTDNVLLTRDGGRTWAAGGALHLLGPVYGSAFVPGTTTVVAVGPGGADVSDDGGRTWRALSDQTYWAVGVAAGGVGWMVGPRGRITRIEW
ncbi:MAG: oxidoreductase [Gemmatimonadota bacterium]